MSAPRVFGAWTEKGAKVKMADPEEVGGAGCSETIYHSCLRVGLIILPNGEVGRNFRPRHKKTAPKGGLGFTDGSAVQAFRFVREDGINAVLQLVEGETGLPVRHQLPRIEFLACPVQFLPGAAIIISGHAFSLRIFPSA